ncbi:MAG TPA: DUF3313 domain-containing protein [Candidatus Binataceae bacterium]|nr:DUF3313 domain-containing protein [Candidatus Binataceae bacterium]
MTRLETKHISAISAALVTTACLIAALIAGCAKTVSEQPEVVKQVQSGEAPAATGFFGKDLSLLQPGKEGQAAMVYISPNTQWDKYNKIMLEPVEFWDSDNSTVSPTDQHMLTSYFYNKLKEDIQKNFTLVDQGGPGVLVVQVALVNASAATPGLRSVSVVVPQLRIINGLQSLATGSYAFVGDAEMEMKATDATSGEFLAGAIDKRAGGIAVSQAAQWKWGDAEAAMDYWADRATNRLLELQGRKPAAS